MYEALFFQSLTLKASQTEYFTFSSQHIRRSYGLELNRCVIRPPSLNILGGTLPDIRDMSALEVSPFHGIALHESTVTYLLFTYLFT